MFEIPHLPQPVTTPDWKAQLLDPFTLNADVVSDYCENIKDRATMQLHDDYCYIWLQMPHHGYSEDLKPYVKQIRMSIIDELKDRPSVMLRLSLKNRLAADMTVAST